VVHAGAAGARGDEAGGGRGVEHRRVVSAATDASATLARYRAVRREVEQAVLPLATSIDGRRFSFQASLHGLALQLGGYVILEGEGGARLGQVLDLHEAVAEVGSLRSGSADDGALESRLRLRVAEGAGVVLDGPPAPFHDALARPAITDEVRVWLERTAPHRARLAIGGLALERGVPFALDAGGFDRHTFLCGQSGSGKTYALGVLLEQLLLKTGLRIVVLDPNSDFVRLARPRDDVAPAQAEAWRRRAEGVVVRAADAPEQARLGLRFSELSAPSQAALLRLDPVADRAEYAELAEAMRARPRTPEDLAAKAGELSGDLRLRIANLGVSDLGVWAREEAGSVLEDLDDPRIRCLVIDLGSLPTLVEQRLVAEAVLAALWNGRARRRPVLVVIDEAHNVCPASPEDALSARATDHTMRIAAEGRKFGLYLLLSTQRPQKVPDNVVSQCDNLVLLRLNNAADAAYAREIFSFAPASLVGLASTFRQGQALIGGKLASHPALVTFGARVSEEGGGDVPADWARAGS